MRYMERVYVEVDVLNEMEELLQLEGPSEDHGRDEVIHTSTATFLNGHEMDVKVCNAEFGPPYVDPVLFESSGVEVSVDAVSDTLKDPFVILHNGDAYHVEIKPVEGKVQELKTTYRLKRADSGLMQPAEVEDLIVRGGLEDIRDSSKPHTVEIKEGVYAYTLVDDNMGDEELEIITAAIKKDVQEQASVLDYINLFQIIIDMPIKA